MATVVNADEEKATSDLCFFFDEKSPKAVSVIIKAIS